ncbi:aminoglycoside phosphotransferase [Hylemonella gracilis]|uniref:Aminoglycoside phosphotransferase n=1 Tax=Hylemonella gracilis TaxID=80880 RepID=A0A4P6UQF1_9BURK|nr:aminoglycoside phosphotransferase [Hylemonella gracilis]
METTLVNALGAMLARETGQPVERIETHISWVLLTPAYAYKLKKPVRFPFVDFSTVHARRHFCEEELRLNRRFAPMIYLDVLPVRGSPASPRLGGANDGLPIDHVVRMRRFAQSSLMRIRLASGGLDPSWIDGLARRLARLHAEASAAPPDGFGSPERVFQSVQDVWASLKAQHDDHRLHTLRTWLENQDRVLRPLWRARRQHGAVRECHGDLHMGNVVLIDGELVPFDCIEFDAELRWIDRMSDVAFLTMDLKAHGRPDLAYRFLDGWLQGSGDHEGLQVLHFYEVYRALVRAMTSGLGPQTGAAPSGPDYLAWASAWASKPPDEAEARLMITHGLSGSGKSMLAAQLVQAAGAIRIRSDVERKRLFGLAPLERSRARGMDIYTGQANDATLGDLLTRARLALQAGYPVIVDAAFLRRSWRREFHALALERHVPFTILDCQASQATLRHRVQARAASGTDASEAGVDVLERQVHGHEPLAPDEQECALQVSTEAPVDIESLAAAWRSAASPC